MGRGEEKGKEGLEGPQPSCALSHNRGKAMPWHGFPGSAAAASSPESKQPAPAGSRRWPG